MKIPKMNWEKKTEERLIVAIGEGQVKGLLVERAQGGWVPRKLQVSLLGQEAALLPEEWLAAFKTGPTHPKTWVILPRQAMSVQILEMPSSKPAEIAEMLRLQLGKLTPYAPEEVMSSHVALEVTPEGYSRILLLVAKREIVAHAVNLATIGGLEVDQVMTSSEGIVRWVSRHPSIEPLLSAGEKTAVLDLDTTFSDFLIVSRGHLEFTRAIPIGLTRLLTGYPESGEDAESGVEKLMKELNFSFASYQSEAGTKGKGPVALAVIGPKACVDPLMNRLGSLGISIIPADPLDGLSIPAVMPESPAPSLTALLGVGQTEEPPLAGFVPEELMLRRILKARGTEIAKLGVLLVSILTVLSLIFIEEIMVGVQRLSELDRQVAALAPGASEVEKARMRVRFSQQRLGGETTILRLLDRLYRMVPEDVVLTEVHFEAGKGMAVKGYSANMSRIFEFVTALERLPIFGTVKTKSVAKRKSGDKEVADFLLTCEMAKRPPKAPS